MGSVDCRSRFMAISLDVAGILQDPNEFANAAETKACPGGFPASRMGTMNPNGRIVMLRAGDAPGHKSVVIVFACVIYICICLCCLGRRRRCRRGRGRCRCRCRCGCCCGGCACACACCCGCR